MEDIDTTNITATRVQRPPPVADDKGYLGLRSQRRNKSLNDMDNAKKVAEEEILKLEKEFQYHLLGINDEVSRSSSMSSLTALPSIHTKCSKSKDSQDDLTGSSDKVCQNLEQGCRLDEEDAVPLDECDESHLLDVQKWLASESNCFGLPPTASEEQKDSVKSLLVHQRGIQRDVSMKSFSFEQSEPYNTSSSLMHKDVRRNIVLKSLSFDQNSSTERSKMADLIYPSDPFNRLPPLNLNASLGSGTLNLNASLSSGSAESADRKKTKSENAIVFHKRVPMTAPASAQFHQAFNETDWNTSNESDDK